MELITYLRFLFTNWVWLVVGLLLGGVIGAGFAYNTADQYLATVSIYVQRAPDAENDNYFTYEGYYAQQTAAAYTDTALELLTNDEIVKRAAATAGMANDVHSIAKLKGTILAKKDAPQLIKVDVTMDTPEEAAQFIEGLSQALKTRTSEINSAGGDAKLGVAQINAEPLVVLVRPLVWLYAAVGAALGMITAALCAGLWWYIRHQR